jgi:MoaA/NifB/PqqE/SkfB family radical SAM enzyme
MKLRELLSTAVSASRLRSFDSITTAEQNLSVYRGLRRQNSIRCLNLPITLLIELTSKCNLSCRMCNVHHAARAGMTIDDALLKRTYDFARTASTVYPFGLGEPLLHPDIAQIVGKYKASGPSVGMITNGMLLTEDMARELILNGLDHLVISIDAADPTLFAEIRKGGDLRRILENIGTLNRLKKSFETNNPYLAFNVVAQTDNFHQLPQIVELAGRLNVLSVTITPITVHSHIAAIQDQELNGNIPRWREILETCERTASTSGIGISLDRLYHVLNGVDPEELYRQTIPCPEPFRFIGIRTNGDLFPCCNWDVEKPISRVPLENDRGIDLGKAWADPGWQLLRQNIISGQYPEQCKACMRNFTRPFSDEYLL